jgi:hypothetical protein
MKRKNNSAYHFLGKVNMAIPENSPKVPFNQYARKTFSDAGRALLLQDEIYPPYLEKENPFRFGCGALALILFPAAIALGIGVALNLLTLPRIDLLQQQFFTLFTQSNLYQSLASQYQNFAAFFSFIYSLIWLTVRLSGAYPFPASIIFTPISFITGILFTWWLFAILLQMVAGWLGGKTKKGAMYAPVVFAFAPQLLYILGIIPGLTVPVSLTVAWTLAITYQIIRSVFGFSWGRTVMTILITLVVHLVLIFLAVVFGVIIGVIVSGAMA